MDFSIFCEVVGAVFGAALLIIVVTGGCVIWGTLCYAFQQLFYVFPFLTYILLEEEVLPLEFQRKHDFITIALVGFVEMAVPCLLCLGIFVLPGIVADALISVFP